MNADLNGDALAQAATLAHLAPSWTPIVNAATFADALARDPPPRARGFGVAAGELYQIDGDRCADCATLADGRRMLARAAALPRIRPGSRPCGAPPRRGAFAALRPAGGRRRARRRRVGAAGGAGAAALAAATPARGGYAGRYRDGRGARDRGVVRHGCS